MTALAQGTAGLALVMGFALLGTRQIAAASVLIAIQSAAVALVALARHQPLFAAATLMINCVGVYCFIQSQRPRKEALGDAHSFAGSSEDLIGGTRFSIILGAFLTVLSQSCGPLALPLAIVLLSVLLAATCRNPLMRLIALVSLQNAVTLAVCLTQRVPPAALISFVLPLPFAAGLALEDTAGQDLGAPAWLRRWLGWLQMSAAVAIFFVSLAIRLDPLASVFAPLVSAWGIAEAWAARHWIAQGPFHRLAALIKLALMLVAIGTTHPALAWLALVGAMSAALFPTLPWRGDATLLAFCGVGLALFGMLTIPYGLPSVSYMSLFAGYAAIAATSPELSVVIVFLIMRQVAQAPLPPIAADILIGIASAGLLACAIKLLDGAHFVSDRPDPLSEGTDLRSNRAEQHRFAELSLVQAGIVAVALGLGGPQERFAAAVLLVLLILTRITARLAHGPVVSAALAGIPPLGVFPGLILALLTISSDAPWLLMPVGLGLVAVVGTSLPASGSWRNSAEPRNWAHNAFRAVGFIPLALALLFGFFAPGNMVDWLRAVTAGVP